MFWNSTTNCPTLSFNLLTTRDQSQTYCNSPAIVIIDVCEIGYEMINNSPFIYTFRVCVRWIIMASAYKDRIASWVERSTWLSAFHDQRDSRQRLITADFKVGHRFCSDL